MIKNLLSLIASIVDFPSPSLNSSVWDDQQKLLPQHRDKLLSKLYSTLRTKGFQYYDKWIKQVKVVGSLTTWTYTSTSDIDCHVVVDLALFNKLELDDALTLDQAQEKLEVVLAYLNRDTRENLPGTKHPIEYFFETILTKVELPWSGLYDVVEEKWIKPPIEVEVSFDSEEVYDYVLRMAEELMGDIDNSIGRIERRVTRIEELEQLIVKWDDKRKQIFQDKIERRLLEIENEIRKIVGTGKEVVRLRKLYMPFSERELIFKFLQKFSYISLAKKLEKLLEKEPEGMTEQKIPELKDFLEGD